MYHSIMAVVLKNKNKLTETVTGSPSLKETNKTTKGLSTHRETLSSLDWIPDTEVHSCQQCDKHGQSRKLSVMLREKVRPEYDAEFTASCGWFQPFKNCYLLHDVKVG